INGKNVSLTSIKRDAPSGTKSGTPRIDFVYLEKGSTNALTAGPNGAKLLEAYSPLRADYLQKAGIEAPADIPDVENYQTPNVQPGVVYDLYDFQLTELAPGA